MTADEDIRDWNLAFIPSMCPMCGWDLLGERESIILLCTQCNSAWTPSGRGFQEFTVGVVQGNKGEVYLPFWRFTTFVDGLKVQPLAYCSPPAIRSAGPEENRTTDGIVVWAPAFKIHPELFLKLSKRMLAYQPREPVEEHLPDSSLYPVTIPSAEASECIRIILAAGAYLDRRVTPDLNQVEVTIAESNLIYLPFTQTGNELVQSALRLSVHRNALQSGKNL
jgi:hypothetical protein